MHRYSLACAMIAAVTTSAPVLAQGSQYASGPLGHAVEVDNPSGGSQYVTELPKPSTESFEALQLAYANLKIPIQVDPSHGLVGANDWRVPHRLCGKEPPRYFDWDSRSGESAEERILLLNIRSSIASGSASAGQSRLTTVITATATDPG